jgi:hypothetical protein
MVDALVDEIVAVVVATDVVDTDVVGAVVAEMGEELATVLVSAGVLVAAAGAGVSVGGAAVLVGAAGVVGGGSGVLVGASSPPHAASSRESVSANIVRSTCRAFIISFLPIDSGH